MLNLRYPGQYFDAETGTNYNMFRTYEPATGRYVQSDPTGLDGGISTFAYVGNNALAFIDPTGLSPPGAPPPIGPFSPEDPPQIPGPEDIPSNIPGGPWTPAGAGQRPGAFRGPKPAQGGGKTMCQWVPRESDGGPPGSGGYWKTQSPGQHGWQRYGLDGNPITPEQAHPPTLPQVGPTKTPEELHMEQEMQLRVRMMELDDGELLP